MHIKGYGFPFRTPRCRVAKLAEWPEVESRFAAWPRLGVVAVSQRAAGRIAPVIARAEMTYGPEAIDWLNAIAEVLTLLEAACLGVPVTRFTLDIAAEVARGTANSARSLVREKGPSKAAEDAELAFAATAFAADALRAEQPAKRASLAARCVRLALDGGTVPEAVVAFDFKLLQAFAESGDTDWSVTADGPFGELWPAGEPEWVTAAAGRLKELEPTLPKLLRLPGW